MPSVWSSKFIAVVAEERYGGTVGRGGEKDRIFTLVFNETDRISILVFSDRNSIDNQ